MSPFYGTQMVIQLLRWRRLWKLWILWDTLFLSRKSVRSSCKARCRHCVSASRSGWYSRCSFCFRCRGVGWWMPTISMTSFPRSSCGMDIVRKQKGRFLCADNPYTQNDLLSFPYSIVGAISRQNQLFLIPISASFSLLKWSVSFYRTDHFVYKKFTIRAIKKGPIPRNFFEKSAQNDEGGGSCPVTNP